MEKETAMLQRGSWGVPRSLPWDEAPVLAEEWETSRDDPPWGLAEIDGRMRLGMPGADVRRCGLAGEQRKEKENL